MGSMAGHPILYPNSKMSADAARNLVELVFYVRRKLEERMKIMNLKVLEVKMIALPDKVLAPGATGAYSLAGIVLRPETKEAKQFGIRMDLDPEGEYDRDDLDPLVNEIVFNLKSAFYPSVS